GPAGGSAVGRSAAGGDGRRARGAAGDEDLDDFREIELALRVLRLEPLERRPQRVGAEHVDRRVDLADALLCRRGVGPFGDANDRTARVADDAAVKARIGWLGAEDRAGRALAAVRRDELAEETAGE